MMGTLRRAKGIALFSVLIMATLLLTLVGAFLSINQASSRMTGHTLNGSRAQDAAVAMVNHAWGLLEQDPAWGTGNTLGYIAPDDLPSGNPKMRLQQDTDAEGLFLVGLFEENGNFNSSTAVRCELRIYNNLANRSVMVEDPPSPQVPARSVRLHATANANGAHKTLEVLMRRKPFVHESVGAGGFASIAPNASLVRFESNDPYVNRVKADSMNLPPASNTRFAERGTAIVTDNRDLRLGAVNLQGANQTVVDNAQTATGGQFVTNGAAPEIPEVAEDMLNIPPNEIEIPDGEYEFGELDNTEWINHQVGYDVQIPNPNGPGSTTVTEYTSRFQKKVVVYTALSGPDGQQWVSDVGISTSYDPPYDPNYGETGYGYNDAGDTGFPGGQTYAQRNVQTIFGTPDAGVTVNLATGQMAFSTGVTIKADGDFRLSAEGDLDPQLLFGYDISTADGVPRQQSIRDGLEAAQNDPETYMSAIQVAGDFSVRGDANGYGSVIAGGNLTLQASSGFRSSPGLGVVIKGQSVTINPATEVEPGFPGEPTSVDYSVYRDAINSYAGGDWSNFDNWLELTSSQRSNIIGASPSTALRSTMLPNGAAHYYDRLKAEMGLVLPPPNFANEFGSAWGGTQITMGQYLRLREWMQTVASGFNRGNGDTTWMDMGQRIDAIAGRLENQLTGHASWAESYKISLQNYLSNPQQIVPDMFYEGLLYAGTGGLTFNGAGRNVRLEGSVISQGNLSITGDKVDLVYDRDALDDLFRSNLGNGYMRLERIFYNLY